MANRCELYLAGISDEPKLLNEHAYEIPFLYKLLVSSNPQVCTSWEWPDEGEIAIHGDAQLGVERLAAFQQQLQLPEAEPLLNQALAVLSPLGKPGARFLLEPGDIFQMDTNDPLQATQNLLEEILTLEETIPRVVAQTRTALRPPAVSQRASLWPWTKKKPVKNSDPLQPLYDLGLGSWGGVEEEGFVQQTR